MSAKKRTRKRTPPLRVYAYRDNLGTTDSTYFGVTIYAVGHRRPAWLPAARIEISNQLTAYMLPEYTESDVSIASLSDAPDGAKDGDMVLEIGELDTGKFRYYLHIQDGAVVTSKIFDDFDLNRLLNIVRGDDDDAED